MSTNTNEAGGPSVPAEGAAFSPDERPSPQETARRMVRIPGRRAVPEWVGATPDTPIPARVKLRIFEREGGVCYLTGRKIQPGDAYDFEHVRSIRNGGENAELNIRLALRDKHREKTAQERTDGSKYDRVRQKFTGTYPKSKTPLRSRGFQKTRAIPKEAAE